eukprot:SRR837773.2133.p1 GENE.SRR837773.2133~~SRR837773.2133.p1  ORF type:complete len:270 (-),score=44.58 SRR837773.2133:14-739(-)
MGEDAPCCGVGAGCGRCLLVRNPSAERWNWTAVIMKKSRCPPESKGCEAGRRHMDFAIPGYEFISESTANVCGSKRRKETYLTASEAGACQMPGAVNASGLCCEAMPNATAEQRWLQNGCRLFSEWGWTSGAPDLEFRSVACPKAWAARVSEAFSSSGVSTLERPSYRWYILGGIILVLICVTIAVVNRIVDRREAKKKYKEMELRKKKKAEQRRKARSGTNTESSDMSHSEDASDASSLE